MDKCTVLRYRGHPEFEPWTSRSAVICSTTELYRHEYRAR